MPPSTFPLLLCAALVSVCAALWDPTARNKDDTCSEQAAMALPKFYCNLYTICCANELELSSCDEKVNECTKVDSTHQKQCVGRNCTELTTTTMMTTVDPKTSAAAVLTPVSVALSVLLAAALSRRRD